MMVGGLPPKSQTFRRKSDKDRGKDSTFDILLARLSSESSRVAGQNPLPYQSSHSPFGTQSSMLMNPLTRSTTSLNGSLDTLMSTMNFERRAAERQPQFSPQACEALRIAEGNIRSRGALPAKDSGGKRRGAPRRGPTVASGDGHRHLFYPYRRVPWLNGARARCGAAIYSARLSRPAAGRKGNGFPKAPAAAFLGVGHLDAQGGAVQHAKRDECWCGTR